MPFIPEQHRKYNLLPKTRGRKDWECFSYPVELVDSIGNALAVNLNPYGYASLKAYLSMLENLKTGREHDPDMISLINDLIQEMKHRNNKSEWSVLKYVGYGSDDGFELTNGQDYYWPCSFENPVYEGVIDDEEYTSYMNYSTDAKDWKILEDPTGMAAKTLKKDLNVWIDGNNYPAAERAIINVLEEYWDVLDKVTIAFPSGWHDEDNLYISFLSKDGVELAHVIWCHADDYMTEVDYSKSNYRKLINGILEKYTDVRVELDFS